jgi:hypothetical protein
MKFPCPIKSHPEYKALVKEFGDDGAFSAYHDHTMETARRNKAAGLSESKWFDGTFPTVDQAAKYIGAGKKSVRNYIKKTQEAVAVGKGLDEGFKLLHTNNGASEVWAKDFIKENNIPYAEAEQIYKYADAIATGQKPPEITEKQKQIYDDVIKPLMSASKKLYEELKRNGVPLDAELNIRRMVADKGGFYEKVMQGSNNSNMGSQLSKSSKSFKHRTMWALEDENGKRKVASISDGNVVGWENKKSSFMGGMKLKTNEDLLDKELKPINDKISKLEQEHKTLTATKGRESASKKRLFNIEADLVNLYGRENDIREKYNPYELNNKKFVDNNGKQWTIKQATTNEIENNTNLKYHKNILLNEVLHYNEMAKIKRVTDFINNFKESLEFSQIAIKSGEGNVPNGWKATRLQQFMGYYFNPKVAETLDYYARKIQGGSDSFELYSAVNSFLRTSIFFNPMIHVPNLAWHALVRRGTVAWLNPMAYQRMIKAGLRAANAVIHQNEDYAQAMQKGANLMYYNTGKSLAEMLRGKMLENLQKDPSALKGYAEATGRSVEAIIKSPYTFSGKITWGFNDFVTLQAMFEEMGKGKSMEHAIGEVSKHIPDYWIPSHIMGSKAVADVMSNPALTMFGAYHYGALKSYGEMVGDLVKRDNTIKDKAEALDKMAMLGLSIFVIYPLLNKLGQQITGDKNFEFRPAGALTFPYNVYKTVTHKETPLNLVKSIATPSIGVQLGYAIGKELSQKQTFAQTGKDIMTEAGKSFAPLKAVTQATGTSDGLKKLEYNLIGVTEHNPKTDLYNFIDNIKMEQGKPVTQPGQYPPGKYKNLKLELANDNLGKAKEEWKKLLKESGKTPKELYKGFHLSAIYNIVPNTIGKLSKKDILTRMSPEVKEEYNTEIKQHQKIMSNFYKMVKEK